MSDIITMPATVEEWQRDMNLAYEKGRTEAEEEHRAMCVSCIHKVSKDDIDAVHKQGREERTAEIVAAIEEIRDCGFVCMHDLCEIKEPTAYDCEKCALDYVIKRIKEQKNGSIET